MPHFGGPELFIIAIIGVVFLICLAIGVWICWLLYDALNRLPPQFRETEPWTAWLLFIPLFGIVWNFFLYPKIARSYRAYYNASGIMDVGDCGEQKGMHYAIASACSIIPYIGAIAGIVSLVFMVQYLTNLGQLKRRIPPQVR